MNKTLVCCMVALCFAASGCKNKKAANPSAPAPVAASVPASKPDSPPQPASALSALRVGMKPDAKSRSDFRLSAPHSLFKGKPHAYSKAFYLWTESNAYNAAKKETDSKLKKLYYQIAATPTAVWFDGTGRYEDSTLSRLMSRANAAGKTPIITVYGIPNRDCGSYSAGGHKTAESYKNWIDRMSRTIGNSDAVIIVEPDAHNFCRWKNTDERYIQRSNLLHYVGQTFARKNPNAVLYLHIGGTEFKQEEAAKAAIDGGIKYMRGFIVNVSDHRGTPRAERWSEEFVRTLAAKGLPGKFYAIDTSRNGVDSPKQTNRAYYYSCNNFNAALGTRSTVKTTGEHADAYLWVKNAGQSDGECAHGDPSAGKWFPAVAQSLAKRALELGTVKELAVPAGF